MVLIMFYEIYFIKHYFFRIIHVNNFILSQFRPAPTTARTKIVIVRRISDSQRNLFKYNFELLMIALTVTLR